MAMAHQQTHLRPYVLPDVEETGNVLGSGAYGEVIELKLHGTRVAGKKSYNFFFESGIDPDHNRFLKEKIEQECVR